MEDRESAGDLDYLLKQNKYLEFGVDKNQHPTIWFIRKRHLKSRNEQELVDNLDAIQILIKRIFERLDEASDEEWAVHQGKLNLVLDCRQYTWANNDSELFKRLVAIVQAHHPERLNKCYIIDATFIVRTIFSLVKPFIDPNTARKVEPIGSDYLPRLKADFTDENIPANVGGTGVCPEYEPVDGEIEGSNTVDENQDEELAAKEIEKTKNILGNAPQAEKEEDDEEEED